MDKYKYKIAEEIHDKSLRSLLHRNPMIGAVSLSFENEPNYFRSSEVGNEFCETIICEDQENSKVVSMLNKSIKKVYMDGADFEIGYLNNLRVDKEYRGKGVITNAWGYLHKIHDNKKIPFYISSIIKDNYQAKRAVITNKKNRLKFFKIADYTTFVISLLRKKKKYSSDIEIVKACREDIDDVVKCLIRNGKKKYFYPSYKKQDFFDSKKTKDFKIENFFIAKIDGKVVGVVGVWDQSKFKQTIVNRYNYKMKLVRFFYNFGANFFTYSPLPKTGEQLKYACLSFVAIDGNNLEVFRSILWEIYNEYVGKEYLHLTLGLTKNDPLFHAVKDFFSIKYESEIYLATYDKDMQDIEKIKNSICYFELATL